MDRIKKQFETMVVGKILCRNSYERKLVHQLAEERNRSHRSIIDYTQMHINQSKLLCIVENRGCCGSDHDCGQYECVISGTPYSFVEIGGGFDKTIIGKKEMIPLPIKINVMGDYKTYKIDTEKYKFKIQHQRNVKVKEVWKNDMICMMKSINKYITP